MKLLVAIVGPTAVGKSRLALSLANLFAGEVVNADVVDEQKTCMTYDYYHQIKGGKTPEAAATYIKEDKANETPKEAQSRMTKYRCTVCGYVYDPEIGDPDGGIKPGTAFEDIPDGWVCPICGATKDQFEKLD